MADIGVLATGNLMGGGLGIGQALQKQVGQTGIPVYNVSNTCTTSTTALRTAIMAIKSRRVRHGPRGRGREARPVPGLLSGGQPFDRRRGLDTARPLRRGRRGCDGRIGTDTMPGVFAQVGMEYGHKYGGTSFELLAHLREEPLALDTQPARGLEEDEPRRDHE